MNKLATNSIPTSVPSHYGVIVGGRVPSLYAESPVLWNEYARRARIDMTFFALDMANERDLPVLVGLFATDPRFIDLTVTDPYKSAAYRVAAARRTREKELRWTFDPIVGHIKSLNHLLKIGETVRVANTDGRGMVDALSERRTLLAARTMVIGAGGAAAAIAYELLDSGAQVHLMNAFPAETIALVRRLLPAFPGSKVTHSDFGAIEGIAPVIDVLVNTVPKGCPVAAFQNVANSWSPIVGEAPYGEKAALNRFAAERGLRYVGGKEMLFRQFNHAVEHLQPILCDSATHAMAIRTMR